MAGTHSREIYYLLQREKKKEGGRKGGGHGQQDGSELGVSEGHVFTSSRSLQGLGYRATLK